MSDEQVCAVDGCENLPVKEVKIQKIDLDENETVTSNEATALLCVEHAGVWGFMPKELVDKLEEEKNE